MMPGFGMLDWIADMYKPKTEEEKKEEEMKNYKMVAVIIVVIAILIFLFALMMRWYKGFVGENIKTAVQIAPLAVA